MGRTVLEGEWEAIDGEPPMAADWELRTLAGRIHGYRPARDAGDGPVEMQQTGGRGQGDPSRMLWRLHRAPGGYRVVMTWAPRGFGDGDDVVIAKESGLYEYLTEKLGLESSLAEGGLAADDAEGATR